MKHGGDVDALGAAEGELARMRLADAWRKGGPRATQRNQAKEIATIAQIIGIMEILERIQIIEIIEIIGTLEIIGTMEVSISALSA